MYEVRCGKKEMIQFGCGHARNEAQITFYQCTLPKGHDEGPEATVCKDERFDHTFFNYIDYPIKLTLEDLKDDPPLAEYKKEILVEFALSPVPKTGILDALIAGRDRMRENYRNGVDDTGGVSPYFDHPPFTTL